MKRPFCNECQGFHEPSGARSDCIAHWQSRAHEAERLVAWAITLLGCVEPRDKTLTKEKIAEWYKNFPRWWSKANHNAHINRING